MKEHDPIVLTNDIANTDLRAGDVGTVVHTYENGTAYEVEFLTLDGHTHAVETIEARSLRAVRSSDLVHTRTVAGVNRPEFREGRDW